MNLTVEPKENLVHVPWYDTLVTGNGIGTLIDGNRYIHYTAPLPDKVILAGFTVNFTTTGVTITLANKHDSHAWSPFYHTPLNSVAGEFDQEWPVLPLPFPVEIPPFSRIQIALENLSGEDITNTRLTLVGTREKEFEILCFS